jgi:hypothetical protein
MLAGLVSFTQAQAQNASRMHWYKCYTPDKDLQGNAITPKQSGEDWFYDMCESYDPRTKSAR